MVEVRSVFCNKKITEKGGLFERFSKVGIKDHYEGDKGLAYQCGGTTSMISRNAFHESLLLIRHTYILQ